MGIGDLVGFDEKEIIDVCIHRTNAQRLEIVKAYKALYRRDLISDLKSELGKSQEAMIVFFTDPIEYDVDELRKAMKGIRTNRDTLIEIIALRPATILSQIKVKFNQNYKRDLEADVKSETSGTLKYF